MDQVRLTEFRKMVNQIESIEDLRTLFVVVRERWRMLEDASEQKARLNMYVGLKVKVRKHREMGVCGIIKMGPKNVIIKDANGREWRIPPTLLTPVEADPEAP
jgi:hypothetical protein